MTNTLFPAGLDPHSVGYARTTLERAGYRVIEPFVPGARTYAVPCVDADVRTGLMIDCETTGQDVRHDQIIEFGAVRFRYNAATGMIYNVGQAYRALEEPTVPISDDAIAVHGITADMVHGQRFDNDEVDLLFNGVSIVVAHNAAFDRPVTERRFPVARSHLWGCSFVDVPWTKGGYGYHSSKLGALLSEHALCWFKGHRADDDCYAAVHILATPTASGDWPLKALLTAIETPRVRLCATNTRYETKDLLKARGYRWCDGTSADAPFRMKCWWTEIDVAQEDAEKLWLTSTVYGGFSGGYVRRDPVDPHTRFAL